MVEDPEGVTRDWIGLAKRTSRTAAATDLEEKREGDEGEEDK